MPDRTGDTTDFGLARIPTSEKARRVGEVFRSVAGKYDLMNDLMSLGSHRLMKRFAVELTAVRPGAHVMDLAGGTGDLTALLSPIVGDEGRVTLCDINESMLEFGRDQLIDHGFTHNIDYVLGDAERLPFHDEAFDAITIAFGLRNVTCKEAALNEMLRVMKPGGKLVVLEFSRPRSELLRSAYKAYSSLWPKVGKAVTGDADSYKYLVESIEVHPDQDTLQDMVLEAGFIDCRYHNLAGGIAAIHTGRRAG